MPASTALSTQIARTLLTLTPQAGHRATGIPGVTLMRADQTLPAAPVLQEPTLVLMGQGVKRGFLGDEVVSYQAGQCLSVTVPMHFQCDTLVAPGQPMLALAVAIDREIVGELLSKMAPVHAPSHGTLGRGMTVADLDTGTMDTVLRLLGALSSPQDAKVLGPQLVRELHYRILNSPGGDTLRGSVDWHGKLGAIHRACERIRADHAQALDVATLAREAAMSTSSFHLAFKTVTGCSPIQYIKATRLQRAHELIVHGRRGVTQAAYEVGYHSASQFSREFKRMFAYPAAEAASRPAAPA